MKKSRHLLNESSRKLTVDAINLLTDAIKEEFGLTVQIGAELEYNAVDPQDPGNKDPLRITDTAKYSGAPPKFFEQSRLISSHYKEEPRNQYELVFSHKNHGPVMLARSIENAKELLLRGAADRKIHVDFKPFSIINVDERVTCGLHLNISLCDENGLNIFNHDYNGLELPLARAALPTLKELMLLHETGDDSYERWKDYEIAYNFNRSIDIRPRKNDASMEFKLAEANIDPYKAIMAQMLALYSALHELGDKRHITAVSSFDRDSQVPQNHEEAVAAFEKGTTLHDTLNKLSEDHTLGNRLHDVFLEEAKNRKRGAPEPALAR